MINVYGLSEVFLLVAHLMAQKALTLVSFYKIKNVQRRSDNKTFIENHVYLLPPEKNLKEFSKREENAFRPYNTLELLCF